MSTFADKAGGQLFARNPSKRHEARGETLERPETKISDYWRRRLLRADYQSGHDANGGAIRWCFADPAVAIVFAKEFGPHKPW